MSSVITLIYFFNTIIVFFESKFNSFDLLSPSLFSCKIFMTGLKFITQQEKSAKIYQERGVELFTEHNLDWRAQNYNFALTSCRLCQLLLK